MASATRFSLALMLAAYDGILISRSQAKQVAACFDGHKEVELDFADVISIGQGFADELLRVWPLAHPQTKLTVINANDAVLKMVGHIRSRDDLPQPVDGNHANTMAQ